jgi:hypothetical protein
LAGQIGALVNKPSAKAACPVLGPGETFTFISTTGSLSGAFSNAPEHGAEIPIYFVKACSHTPQAMRIDYNRSGGAETVTGTVEAQVAEREQEEALKKEEVRREEVRREEVRREEGRREEETKQKEEVLKRAGEETARKAIEEAVASVKRHQEEEAAGAKNTAEAGAKSGVLGVTTTSKPKPLTRAQLFAKALKKCKKQPKPKRAKCVALARKRYGPKAKSKKG